MYRQGTGAAMGDVQAGHKCDSCLAPTDDGVFEASDGKERRVYPQRVHQLADKASVVPSPDEASKKTSVAAYNKNSGYLRLCNNFAMLGFIGLRWAIIYLQICRLELNPEASGPILCALDDPCHGTSKPSQHGGDSHAKAAEPSHRLDAQPLQRTIPPTTDAGEAQQQEHNCANG